MVSLYHFIFLKGYLPQILHIPFLNILSHLLYWYKLWCNLSHFTIVVCWVTTWNVLQYHILVSLKLYDDGYPSVASWSSAVKTAAAFIWDLVKMKSPLEFEVLQQRKNFS